MLKAGCSQFHVGVQESDVARTGLIVNQDMKRRPKITST